ncbi:methyltransferase domain-containing protein [Telmatospirillum sp.]|uniref:class I SAM-dependent methyltransferase n=1 Tax=Telmatospirillum sp. TaxID=2079197 RepID=UPI002849DF6B|nr:methyltransferase domain-containing protein [Telmatospirillum sp.]MDR3436974.1 methyltransferase domain-containing protein [Telmatospirillum sp.]
MSIHQAAATGFASQAETYQRGRPDYPVAIEAWLREKLGLRQGRHVLDLGAGTGKFTKRLVATGADVVAVEPVAEMRGQFTRSLPDVPVLAGSADAIPLPANSLDAVVCAQSFHWFATRETLAEIHRILRPDGMLGLVWNVRDESVPWVQAITDILRPYEGDAPRFANGDWKKPFPAPGFTPLEESRFPHTHQGPAEQVIIERMLSVSFIAALAPDQRSTVEAALRRLIASTTDLAGHGEILFPYRTSAFACRRLAG